MPIVPWEITNEGDVNCFHEFRPIKTFKQACVRCSAQRRFPADQRTALCVCPTYTFDHATQTGEMAPPNPRCFIHGYGYRWFKGKKIVDDEGAVYWPILRYIDTQETPITVAEVFAEADVDRILQQGSYFA